MVEKTRREASKPPDKKQNQKESFAMEAGKHSAEVKWKKIAIILFPFFFIPLLF